MKKTSLKLSLSKLSLFMALFSFLVLNRLSAQPEAGNFIIGGDLNLRSSPSTFLHGVGISPGYFLSDRLSAGIVVSYSARHTSQTVSVSDSREVKLRGTNFNYSLGPQIRYHIPLHDKISFTNSAQLLFSSGTRKNESFNVQEDRVIEVVEPSGNTFRLNVAPNLSFYFMPKLALDIRFGNLSFIFDQESDELNFNLNLNSASVQPGLVYYF